MIRVQKQANPDFVPFSKEDMVRIKNHIQKWPHFVGPFQIVKVRGAGLSYDLSELDGNRRFTRAATELRPYHQRQEEALTSNDLAALTPVPTESEESRPPITDVKPKSFSRRSLSSTLLSDFFSFENFPPLNHATQSQNNNSAPE